MTICAAGREALEQHRRSAMAKKPSLFKRFTITFIIRQLGEVRASKQVVIARTDSEAIKKLERQLKKSFPNYEHFDFEVESSSNV